MGDAVLTDPGYPDSHLTQVNYKFFQVTGLTWVFFGPGPLNDLFAELSRVAPTFQTATALPNGLGQIGTREDMAWLGSEGPKGSAIALFCFPGADSGFVLDKFVKPTDKLRKPWQRGMGVLGASVDTEIATVYAGAITKPVWEIAGLEHTKPQSSQGDSTSFPELLAIRLIEAGWEAIDQSLFRSTVPGYNGRTQLLFFTAAGPSSFALMSPVADSPDDTVPPGLRGRSFGDYTLDAMAGMVLLIDTLPAGPPSPTLEEIHTRGLKLALFADRVEGDLSTEDTY